VSLLDASESCFFFPMVMRWPGGEGGSGGVGGVDDGRNDVGRLLKTGHAGDTTPLMAAQKSSRNDGRGSDALETGF
jgi:hypothetical protein